MSSDTEMLNSDSAPIQFISEKMETLQVPDYILMSCEYCKDGKLYFNEPKLRAECHPTIAERILQYRMYRAQMEKEEEPLADIPSSYMDLIAALVQDSDESVPALTSRINDLLSPFLRNENVANKFESAIEKAIRRIAHKINYGLKEEIYSNIQHTAPKIPWHLYISRWEVNNVESLPIDIQQAISQRRHIRENMTRVFTQFIQNLSPDQRSSLVNTKHRKSTMIVQKETEDVRVKQVFESEQEREEKLKKKEEEKKKKEEEKRLHDEKRAIEEEKKKQREEEKRLRDEEKKRREDEKKKKEQSQLRLTSLFQKSTHIETTPPVEKLLEPAKPTLFPAFYIKDHVTISDQHATKSTTTTTITTTTSNSSSYHDFRNAIHSQLTPPGAVSIKTFLSEINQESKQKRGVSTHVDIRTLLLPGSADILHVPNVRMVLRMKLLQFTENVRPAYYGTFTQKSIQVTGRRPFAKDQDKLDYDHDSEAEWEPEGEGEDIVSGDEDEDDPNTDMIDPEDVGWLVPEGYLSDNEGVEEEEEKYNRFVSSSSSSSKKRFAVRKIILGPYFHGETEEDEVLKPFETNFFIDVMHEGYNPFYKEPVSRATTATTTTTTTTHTSLATVSHATTLSNTAGGKSEFTEQHRTELINVINEKSGDSIPNLINEAKSNWLLKDVSKRQLEANIKSIAVKEKRGNDTKPTWYIKDIPST